MGWILFLFGIGSACLYLSRHQPFPEISRNFSYLVVMTAALLLISEQGPRETNPIVPAGVSLVLGVFGTLRGSWHMTRTSKDVLLAPFGGCLMCIGSISLMVGYWDNGGTYEHISSFVLASTLVLMEIYLVFRGLIIGVPGISWSKAGLRQIQRGLLEGPSGAIACFENSWDEDEDWLGAMSQAALVRIHEHLGQNEAAAKNRERLDSFGGEETIDGAWIGAIEEALSSLSQSAWAEPTDDM